MERLTEWNELSHKHAYYPRCFEEPCYGSGCKIKDCPFETAVCERLAAYEDTGLYPESVEALKLHMMGKAISEITEFDGLPIDRLRELAEADKDGRVLILPCKVGDTIYFARANPILQYKVTGYEMGEASISQVRSKHVDKETGLTFNFTFRPSSIGKTVFLTHEEAEKALQEMEGKKDG